MQADVKSKLTIANPSSKYDMPTAFIVCTMMILLRLFEVPWSLQRRMNGDEIMSEELFEPSTWK